MIQKDPYLDSTEELKNLYANRIREIEDYWNQHPGAAPGGSGSTGLQSSDAVGWSRILQMQIEHQNMLNKLQGKPDMNVRQGAPMGGMPESIAEDPTSRFNLNPYSPGNDENIKNQFLQVGEIRDPRKRSQALVGLRGAMAPWNLG